MEHGLDFLLFTVCFFKPFRFAQISNQAQVAVLGVYDAAVWAQLVCFAQAFDGQFQMVFLISGCLLAENLDRVRGNTGSTFDPWLHGLECDCADPFGRGQVKCILERLDLLGVGRFR